MDNELQLLEGVFTYTLYKSDSYMVSKFKCDDEIITVTGPSFDYEKDQKYIITGSYIDHPKYGFQFKMLTIEKYLPSKKDEIISFLRGKTFPGIGKKAAEKIYDYFGNDTLSVLKENPEKILELDLTQKQLSSLQKGFEQLNDPENEILFHLVSNGFNNNDAQKIINRFKLATVEVGQDNPFRYYTEVNGISFDKVKHFAQNVDFEDKLNKYREAYIVYLLTEISFNSGDMYIEYEDLLKQVNKAGGMDNYDEIIDRCVNKNYLYIEDNRVYLFDDYQDECFISSFLLNFKHDLHLDDELIKEGIENNENEHHIKYDDKQKQAITNFFKQDLSIIVGGPGTGKTTIVKAMVQIFRDYFPYNNLMVIAPTGRAAKRINEICDVESKTIHSLLRWNKETDTFVYNVDNPFVYDALIIDEFSMVDNSLFASLLKASSKVKKICIIGDHNQLPSIRPGDLLNDLMSSNVFPLTELESNYRQSKGNEIISLANDIINNDVDINRYNNDIKFFNIYHDKFNLIDLIKDNFRDGYDINDVQVLSPMYKGEWGIDNLNISLQDTFNPGDITKKEKKGTKYIFRENDKIIQLKNRPTEDVYNGDIGILEDIDNREKSIMVNYNGNYIFYNFDDLSDISLAYAMSVHKSQGSEYKIVYFIFNRSNYHMLNKNLIYTAITRCKNKLVIIGDEELLKTGINRILRKRQTRLQERLNEKR